MTDPIRKPRPPADTSWLHESQRRAAICGERYERPGGAEAGGPDRALPDRPVRTEGGDVKTFETPPDVRPYHPAHQPGDERITHTDTHRQLWRQVGWHGQSGAFYALTEDPSRHEPGSFSPLWLLVDDEPTDRYGKEDNRGA